MSAPEKPAQPPKKPRIRPRLVMVEWVDIISHSGWHSVRDALEMEPLKCMDVGWMIRRDERALTLVRSRQSDGGVGDVAVIPTGCVVRVHELERAKKPAKESPP